MAIDIEVEELARRVLVHSAWGYAHSRRAIEFAVFLAREEKMEADRKLLHIGGLLHDFGAYPTYRKEGVDHAISSADFAEKYLAGKGIRGDNLERICAIIRGHMYYTEPDARVVEAVLFHDADSLDLLGAVGISRVYSIVGKDDWAEDMTGALERIKKFQVEIPPKLITKSAKRIAGQRIGEMDDFIGKLKTETLNAEFL